MEEKKSTYRGYTEAQNKATQKYKRENYFELRVAMKKEKADRYKQAAKKAGMSFAQFAAEAMDEKIERDLLD